MSNPRKKFPEVTLERVNELLDYNKESGIFTWKKSEHYKAKIGNQAGFINSKNGYVLIGIDGKPRRAHRLAWLIVYGEHPREFIDHINGNKSDNRIANLRDVSRRMNQENFVRPNNNNKCGFLGVYKSKKKYVAQLTVDRKAIRVGLFETAEQAYDAYLNAKRLLHKGNSL